jgi:hypothetical protein
MQESVGSSIFEEEQIDLYAEQAHQIFCEDLLGQGYRYGPVLSEEEKTHPALVPYEQLSEDRKQLNREFVRDISRKIASAGFTISPKQEADAQVDFPGSDLERLAEMEHERWVGNMHRAGWRAGPETDPERKIHASIVEWGELSASEREKDRWMVRAIPRILALAGYAVTRMGDQA